jgi:hypothetical protein
MIGKSSVPAALPTLTICDRFLSKDTKTIQRTRIHSTGLPESLERAQRKTFVPHPYGLPRLLSQFQTAFIAGLQLTDTAGDETAVAGQSLLDSAGRRIASPILACGVIVDISLPGLFAATGLWPVVKQPDARGIR